MKTCVTLLLLAGTGIAVASDPKPVTVNKPNLIVILSDDLGYGDLGCYGQKKIQTPHLDRMAAEGMRFTQAYAGSTVCAPSRCVLMTGLDTGHARIRGNEPVPLRPEDLTVAEVLKGAGYATGLIGNWGLGEAGTAGVPNRQGFDYFFGYLNQVHAHNYYPAFLWRNDVRVPLKNEVASRTKNGFGQGWATKKVEYSHDLFAAEALAWVEQNKQRPFFLYLALTIPHANNQAASAFGNGAEVPDLGDYKDKDWTEPNKGYAAMITRMDTDIGRLFARLKQLGLDDHTLVIFTSDNGPEKKESAGFDTTFFQSNGPLRGHKRDLYEGGIRVPMMARWPGKIKAGAVCDQVVAFCDVLPTAAELAGAKAPANITGISIVPALLGQPQPQHDTLYWEFHEGPQSAQAIRVGDWKAIRFGGPGHSIALYDLKTDLAEQHDVASTHPDIMAKAEVLLNHARTANPSWPLKPAAKTQNLLQKTAFHPLPLGAVKARGWMKDQLRVQADGLTSWTWSAFDAASFDACPPYHQEGVIALAYVLGDERLIALAKGYADRRLSSPTCSHQITFTTASLMRGLMEYQEATGDPRVVPWMAAWYKDADWRETAGWDNAGREEHLLALHWLYNRTGDAHYLALAKREFGGPSQYTPAVGSSGFPAGNVETVTEAFLGFPKKKPSIHGVAITWKLKYPALYWLQDPQERFREAPFAGMRELDRHYGQIGAHFAAHEHLPGTKSKHSREDGRCPTHGTELCNLVETGFNLEKFIEIFGDPAMGDRLESLAFNIWPGVMTADMWTHQYDTQANQVVVSVAQRGWDNSEWANIYGLTANWTCCLANMHQAWPRFVKNQWMATADGGLAATLLGPCEVRAKVGANGQDATITEDTGYPFDGDIRFTVHTAKPVEFPLQVRVPGWAQGATLGGAGAGVVAKPGTFATLKREWKDGDTVTLRLPMNIRLEERFHKAQAVQRGPLYFALRIGCEYRECNGAPIKPGTRKMGLSAKPIREKTGFPVFDWEIFPTTPWNYALVLDPANPAAAFTVERHPVGQVPFAGKDEPVIRRVTGDPSTAPFKADVSTVIPHPAEFDLEPAGKTPWKLSESPALVGFERTVNTAYEPIVLKVKGRLVPQWTMEMGKDRRTGKMVPAKASSTPVSPVAGVGPEVELELVPYGSTRLRVAEFPISAPSHLVGARALAAEPSAATTTPAVPPASVVAPAKPSGKISHRYPAEWAENSPRKTVVSTGWIPDCPMTKNLQGCGLLERHPGMGYWCWSAWPVQDDKGKFHIFGERWTGQIYSFNKTSELTHYVADKPEGPYAFVDVPVSRGKEDEPDHALVYPCVQRDGNRWVMLYSGMGPQTVVKGHPSMKTFAAVADSLDGPWTKKGIAIERPKDPNHWLNAPTGLNLGIHCSTFVQFHGKWLAYFKGGSSVKNRRYVNEDYLGVAVADHPEGPYTIMDKPCILKNGKHVGTYLEDIFPFVMNDKVCLLIDDNFGGSSGLEGGIMMLESSDGLTFDYDKRTLAIKLIPDYFKEFDPAKISQSHGGPAAQSVPGMQGPRILFMDGKPAYFFGTSACDIKGRGRPMTYIIKFND